MTYRWAYQDAAGGDAAGPDVAFDDQADAEDWLSREFQALLDGGVEQVVLLDGDAEVYTMSLLPE